MFLLFLRKNIEFVYITIYLSGRRRILRQVKEVLQVFLLIVTSESLVFFMLLLKLRNFFVFFTGKTQIPICDIISIVPINHRKSNCLKGFTINYGKRGNKRKTINKWKLEIVHLYNNEIKIIQSWIQVFQTLINGKSFPKKKQILK